MNWLWSWSWITTNTLPYPALPDIHQIWRHVYIIRSCDHPLSGDHCRRVQWMEAQICHLPEVLKNLLVVRQPIIYQWSMITSFSLQASHIIRLVPTSPSINMSLRGDVNYRDHLSWSTIVITQQRLFLNLTVHITDLRSFVIFHNRVSLCVWKLACQKVRMWLHWDPVKPGKWFWNLKIMIFMTLASSYTFLAMGILRS